MPILIDYINDSPDVIKSKFSSIQRRFFDHFSLKLTTETNKYVYINDYLNKYTTKLFGNNNVINGLKCTLIEYNSADNYAIFEFEKGTVVSDSVLIEFTDNFQIKQSLNNLDTNDNDWNIAFIKFKNIITYPSNVAEINILSKTKIEETFDKNLFNGIVSIFKLNNDTVTIQYPNYDSLTSTSKSLTVFNKTYQISPYIESSTNFLNIITDSMIRIFQQLIYENAIQEDTLLKLYEFMNNGLLQDRIITISSSQEINHKGIYLVNNSEDITLTLDCVEGTKVTIKKISNNDKSVTIKDIKYTTLIDGSYKIILDQQYDTITLVKKGDQWYIISVA